MATESNGNPVLVNASARKLRAQPVQLIETDDGILLKRGVNTIMIRGNGGASVVRRILVSAGEGSPREDILQPFEAADREAAEQLIEQLVARGMLSWAGPETDKNNSFESELDVFFWNFGCTTGSVATQLDRKRIAIVGVNYISQRLASTLAAAGVSNFTVVDYHRLRNLRLFDESGTLLPDRWHTPLNRPLEYFEWANSLTDSAPGCLVVTSDFGATGALRDWNRHCVEQNWHFIPVVLLDLVGYIGPIVVPGQTACYECLRARQNSHMENPAATRTPESRAFEGQFTNGFHPSMANVLGDLTALELTKFYGDSIPSSVFGALIEVNLLVPSLKTRRVLKVPRCTVCGNMNTRSSSALDTTMNMQSE